MEKNTKDFRCNPFNNLYETHFKGENEFSILIPKSVRVMYLKLNESEKKCLENIAFKSSDARLVKRALALLAIDAGQSPQSVAARYQVARSTIYNWINRGRTFGFTYEGLCDRPRPGRPRVVLNRESNDDPPRHGQYRD